MPIVNYVREHIRFMEYATDEHLTSSERLLWYALMHVMNQRAQGNIWPDEFVRISNDRLLSYCPMKFDTMAAARNALKQRGLIEFVKGEKNKVSPAYRMIYFYPQYAAPTVENDGVYPEKSDNMGGNTGGNLGGNMGNNPGGNMGDISINYIRQEAYTRQNPPEIHTQTQNNREYTAQARGEYVSLNGEKRLCRYDSAWKTSDRARAAVAQRIIDGFSFACTGDLHSRIVEYMGMMLPPELMEDVGQRAENAFSFLRMMDEQAEKQGIGEEDEDWNRCLAAAHGNLNLAHMLYRAGKTAG